MREYEIVVENNRTLDFLIDRMVDNEYTEEEIVNRCRKILELEGGHMISTMEQYFKLLGEINDITYENYSIYPEGDYILMFAD